MSQSEDPKSGAPELPKGVTADHIINNYSGNEKAELAKRLGLSAVAFERFLEKQAREERVKQTIGAIQKTVSAMPAEKTPYDRQAEEAVMSGVGLALGYIRQPSVSTTMEDHYEKKAYEFLNEIENAATNRSKADLRRKAIYNFGQMIDYRIQREVVQLLNEGKTFSQARQIVTAKFYDDSKKQNIPELAQAFKDQALKLDADIALHRVWSVLGSLAQQYRSGTLDEDARSLLQDLVAFGKAVYFKGKTDDGMLERFGLQGLSREAVRHISDAYKKYGPHKTTSDRVAGPTEVYGSTQSGNRNMGYNRTGKRRPHRGTPDDDRF